jgi:hypothetical protein
LSRNIEDGNAGAGSADFARLVDAVSRAAPEVRVRFTSPHPKDFPPHLIELIAERESCSRHSIGGSPAGAGRRVGRSTDKNAPRSTDKNAPWAVRMALGGRNGVGWGWAGRGVGVLICLAAAGRRIARMHRRSERVLRRPHARPVRQLGGAAADAPWLLARGVPLAGTTSGTTSGPS